METKKSTKRKFIDAVATNGNMILGMLRSMEAEKKKRAEEYKRRHDSRMNAFKEERTKIKKDMDSLKTVKKRWEKGLKNARSGFQTLIQLFFSNPCLPKGLKFQEDVAELFESDKAEKFSLMSTPDLVAPLIVYSRKLEEWDFEDLNLDSIFRLRPDYSHARKLKEYKEPAQDEETVKSNPEIKLLFSLDALGDLLFTELAEICSNFVDYDLDYYTVMFMKFLDHHYGPPSGYLQIHVDATPLARKQIKLLVANINMRSIVLSALDHTYENDPLEMISNLQFEYEFQLRTSMMKYTSLSMDLIKITSLYVVDTSVHVAWPSGMLVHTPAPLTLDTIVLANKKTQVRIWRSCIGHGCRGEYGHLSCREGLDTTESQRSV